MVEQNGRFIYLDDKKEVSKIKQVGPGKSLKDCGCSSRYDGRREGLQTTQGMSTKIVH